MPTPTPEDRDNQATRNLQHALNELKAGIGIASLRWSVDGYQIVFKKGKVELKRRDIDPAVLDDGPETVAIRNFVQKVRGAFGGASRRRKTNS
jgi:hypothetical protein